MKAAREKLIIYWGTAIQIMAKSHQKNWRPESSRMTYSRCWRKQLSAKNSISSKTTLKSESEMKIFSETQRLRYCDAAAAAKLLQSCPTLWDPIDGSPPGSPDPEILQARTLEWVAISLSNAWKWKVKSESEVAQSCPTLCNPMDCSRPGSSVHGIFQARVLEWGAIALSELQATPCTKGGEKAQL